MAPKDAQLGKRVKLVSVCRPFVYGTTARPFHPEHNPKPAGVPETHTHSWCVFVRGIEEDVDVTYWLRRVQFKLHESIPNHIRTIEGEPGKPFSVQETGWGEFEITIRLYYAPESGEKPQALYHYLRLHPLGRTEAERDAIASDPRKGIRAWYYEEQLFNEPYEAFYRVLTSNAHPKNLSAAFNKMHAANSGKGKGKGKGGSLSVPALPADPDGGGGTEVWQRTAMTPARNRPGQPFSHDTERMEIEKIQKALEVCMAIQANQLERLKALEAELDAVRAQNIAAGAGGDAGKGKDGTGRAGKSLSKQASSVSNISASGVA